MQHYYTAQICKKGCLLDLTFDDFEGRALRFCPNDGEQVISKCQHCGKTIPGLPLSYDFTDDFDLPMNCYFCGKPYPWLERVNNIVAAFSSRPPDFSTCFSSLETYGKEESLWQRFKHLKYVKTVFEWLPIAIESVGAILRFKAGG